jgi:hypothetical protein
MRTVLNRSAGRASFILVLTGMVGSVAFPAAPVMAQALAGHHPQARVATHAITRHTQRHPKGGSVRLGPAVAYVRGPNGSVHRVR